MSSSIFTARRGCGRDRGGRQSQHNRRHTIKKDTPGEILSLKKSGARVIVVGLTVSMPHKTLGVSCADGIYTMHSDEFLGVIAQAGSGYHFFWQICGKIVMSRESQHSKI
jgi:sigma 54 modulation protein/ribosomal protein S30EA